MKTWLLVIVAIASALCTWLSAAPIGSGMAAILAPLLLILIALHARKHVSTFGIIFLTQLPVWLVLHAWVMDVALLGWMGIGLYMSIWAPLFVWLLMKVQHIRQVSVVISAPVMWVGLECIRGIVVFDGYPWFLAGTGVVDWQIAQVATIGSVWLVSYLVLWIAAVLAHITHVRWWTIAILVLVCVDSSMRNYGNYRLNAFRDLIHITVIQTNVPQSNKVAWTWERQLEDVADAMTLTYKSIEDAEEKPSLVIWPETMVPGSGFEVSRLDFAPWDVEFTPFWYWADKIRQISNEVGIPILVGSQTWTTIEVIEGTEYLTVNPEKQFNSAVLVQPDGLTERYDKIFLTPFGERIPYLEHLTTAKNWIRDTFGAAMLFDLHAGGEPNRFVLPAENLKHDLTEITFATPICFEDTVPSVVRNLVWEDGIRKAGALINLSNDGWFGSDSSAHEQHVREARMRCIENQTPMVRAANTGISCYIDENGRVRNALPILEEGILPILVQSGVQRPMSRFIGDSVAWVCLVGGILLVVVSCSKCRKGQEDENTM